MDTMTKLSYFDDFTPKEREMMQKKRLEEGMNWKDVLKRFGHPKDWWKNEVGQIQMDLD